MNSRLRLLAWQIDVFAHERGEGLERRDDRRGHVAKWEGGGPQNRYERVRFSPWPQLIQRLRHWSTALSGRRRDDERFGADTPENPADLNFAHTKENVKWH